LGRAHGAQRVRLSRRAVVKEVAIHDEQVSGDSQDAVTVSVAAPLLLEGLRVEPVRTLPEQDEGKVGNGFVDMFRASSPYIQVHSGQTMVIHITSVLLETEAFVHLMDDLALVKLLGVRLVLVVSTRLQLETRFAELGATPKYCGDYQVHDKLSLQLLKEVCGLARAEVEARMSRSMRTPAGLGTSVNVVSGNFFYTARPIGVRNGIDFGYSGQVQRIDVEKVQNRLDAGDVVLLTALGYAASGRTYGVVSSSLATAVAAQLKASKLIWITNGHRLVNLRGELVQSLRLSDARKLVQYYGLEEKDQPGCEIRSEPAWSRCARNTTTSSVINVCRHSIAALEAGVPRAHLVSSVFGELLRELYTCDGAGTLICRDVYDGIRKATDKDVLGIMEMIQPLMDAGILTHRTHADMLEELEHAYVFVRDETPMACGMLVPHGLDHAEISCLAVQPKYRGRGRGDIMLTYLERIAVQAGITNIFVLSTQSMQWFMERGFEEVGIDRLPRQRRERYNWQRRSKVYLKELRSVQEVVAEELFLNAD